MGPASRGAISRDTRGGDNATVCGSSASRRPPDGRRGGRADRERDHGGDRWQSYRPHRRRPARRHRNDQRPGDDGHPRRHDERGRSLSSRRRATRRLHHRLHARRLHAGEPHRDPCRSRLHRDGQHPNERGRRSGERHGDRSVAGRRRGVHEDHDDLRRRDAGERPERKPRLLGGAVGNAGTEADPRRRRRQRLGIAVELLRLRHHGSEPADGRRHQLHAGHRTVRQLRGHGIVRRDCGECGGAHGGDGRARHPDDFHQQVGRQHVSRLGDGPLREGALAVVQHRRPADRARHHRRRRARPARREPASQVSRHRRGRRRLRGEGSPLVVRGGTRPGN